MQSIGETIEFRVNSLRDADVDGSSAAGGDAAAPFLLDDDAGHIFTPRRLPGARGDDRLCLERLPGGYPDHRVDTGPYSSGGYRHAGERRITIERIHRNGRLRRLPIIGAKMMKGDRDRCLEADVSDYLAKPVNTEQPSSICLRDAAASLIGGENAQQ